MLAASVDEGYLKCVNYSSIYVVLNLNTYSITQYCEDRLQTADEVVQEMRRTVEEETNLTVSAGIAPNKVTSTFLSSILNADSEIEDARQGDSQVLI